MGTSGNSVQAHAEWTSDEDFKVNVRVPNRKEHDIRLDFDLTLLDVIQLQAELAHVIKVASEPR